MITFGALLGKITFAQLFLLSTLEVIFYSLNQVVITQILGAVDIGGSMSIHMFGAYFGLTSTFFFKSRRAIKDEYEQNRGNYNSQTIAMIGTIFLFMFFPSFNAALAVGTAQQRAIINTWLSITGSAIMSVFICRLMKGRLDMEIILRSTIAGGVILGGSCNLIFNGGFAMLTGCLAGIASSLGQIRLDEFMMKNVKIHDTCGV